LYATSVEKNGAEWGRRLDLVTKTETLGWVLFLFGIQHALFIGARIGVWLFLQIFCLGCVCIDDDAPELRPGAGQDSTDFDPYAFNIASFNFEEYIYHDRNLGNFNNADAAQVERDIQGWRNDPDFAASINRRHEVILVAAASGNAAAGRSMIAASSNFNDAFKNKNFGAMRLSLR
jgi:hypothetical protein